MAGTYGKRLTSLSFGLVWLTNLLARGFSPIGRKTLVAKVVKGFKGLVGAHVYFKDKWSICLWN